MASHCPWSSWSKTLRIVRCHFFSTPKSVESGVYKEIFTFFEVKTAFNQAQFFDGLEKITQGIANSQQPQSEFILDFLALLDISKTTLNDIRNQNTRTNVAKNLEFAEVALKYKIYFKPTGKIIVICYLIVI